MHRLLPIALLIACSDYKVHAIDDGNNGADAPGSSSDDPSPENDADPGLESGDVSGQICDPSGDGWVVAVNLTGLRAADPATRVRGALGLPPLAAQGAAGPSGAAAAAPLHPSMSPERAARCSAFCTLLPPHTRAAFELAYAYAPRRSNCRSRAR